MDFITELFQDDTQVLSKKIEISNNTSIQVDIVVGINGFKYGEVILCSKPIYHTTSRKELNEYITKFKNETK